MQEGSLYPHCAGIASAVADHETSGRRGETADGRSETALGGAADVADRQAPDAGPATGVGRDRRGSTSARRLTDDPRTASGVRSRVRGPDGRKSGPAVEDRQERALATAASAGDAPSWRTDLGSRSFFAARCARVCDPVSGKAALARVRAGPVGRGRSPHGDAGTRGLRRPAFILKRILQTSAVR